MSKSYLIQLYFLLFFLLFTSPYLAFSQIFNRVENSVGLGNLNKNNGFSVSDYDNDGDLDIFVVAYQIEDPTLNAYHQTSWKELTLHASSGQLGAIQDAETRRYCFHTLNLAFQMFWFMGFKHRNAAYT